MLFRSGNVIDVRPCEDALEAEDVLWGAQDGQNTDGGATQEVLGSGQPCVAGERAGEKSRAQPVVREVVVGDEGVDDALPQLDGQQAEASTGGGGADPGLSTLRIRGVHRRERRRG